MVGRHPDRKYSYMGKVYDVNGFVNLKYQHLKADKLLEINKAAANKARDEGAEFVQYSLDDITIKVGGDDKLMIIPNGEGKFLVTNDEGITTIMNVRHDNQGEGMTLDLYISRPGFLSMVPSHEVELTVSEILAECDSETVDIKDFIRTFGSRLHENYRLAVDAISDELGLKVVTVASA